MNIPLTPLRFLRYANQQYPAKTAVICGDHRYTYSQFSDRAAHLAGALLANLYSFTPDFGGSFMLRSFVIIVLGGLESFSGVAIGAVIVALIETFSILVVPASYQLAISFILLVVALLVLPGGIEGLLQRRRRLR